MKKFVLTIISLVLFIGLFAQTYVVKDNWYHYEGKATDTIDATGTLTKIFKFDNVDYPYNYRITQAIDTLVTCNAKLYCIAYGSNSGLSTDYTRIGDTIKFAGTADTIITLTNTTLATETTTAGSHTITTATYTVRDTVGTFTVLADSIGVGDSVRYVYPTQPIKSVVPAITNTVAAQTITNTITVGGVNWKYIKLFYKGAGAAARYELEHIVLFINRVPGYF